MLPIIYTLVIFLSLIKYIIIIDIISSWLAVLWLNLNMPIIRDIMSLIKSIISPMYKFIRKYIPTYIWPIDFTPLIILIIITILLWIIYAKTWIALNNIIPYLK